MSGLSILLIIGIYFSILLLISFIAGRRGTDNEAFFLGNRRSPWWVVAIGMVGSSLSGVSFVSVPGMVRDAGFTYMQTVVGFFFGYLVIAGVLLPLYYRGGFTSIYTYLEGRFGRRSYKTGAAFFLVSKTIGAAARLYVVALMLQTLVFDALGVPFVANVCGIIGLIWLYTFRSGIKAIVWTDTLQTVVMVGALVLLIVEAARHIGMGAGELASTLAHSEMTRVFVLDDWHSKQNFFKQFFSGIFIAIVMTGLDQDMMQKNLTCHSLRDAQRNMRWYGAAFMPVNFLFLTLGAMLLLLAGREGIALPASSDEILPTMAAHHLGRGALVLFVVGLVAAAFSSADSALAALTTSFAVDILGIERQEAAQAKRTRLAIHAGISAAFVGIILLFRAVNNTSVLDAIYTIVSYTYGPLLGLYAYGLFSRRPTCDRAVPFIAVAAPLLCGVLDYVSRHCWGYAFGYELLMLNGALTFAGLWVTGRKGIGTNKQIPSDGSRQK